MYKIRDWLYIGNYRDTKNLPLLKNHNIGAALLLADDAEMPEIEKKVLLVEDGVSQTPDDLANGIKFIRAQKADGKVVLSACGAGISRSTTYAIGALKEEEGGAILDILLNIKKYHPNALPHIRLWHSLNQYYDEKTPYQEIWKAMRNDQA
ncbi:MAG: dual specificity protein phosphatase family protein [Chloroflexota bacterium]